MFTPTHVQLKYWFYPVGNTPAVNLLRDLPAADEDETIRILLLACGDPRNILFSFWCEQGSQTKRTIDFTCCDIEPAVLARNVVLFTLITDKASAAETWDLFYHFYVPETSLASLRTQVARLLDVSDSIERWASSPYGRYVGFVDKATLQELRQYWLSYGSVLEWPQARTAIAKRSKEIGSSTMLSGVRAAGPFWFHASSTMAHMYRRFWETGVAGGNSEDLNRLKTSSKVNPMFAVSSAATGDFSTHYGTDPLLGFHLAEAFQDRDSQRKGTVLAHADQVVRMAKTQFDGWCESFRDYIEKDRTHIKLFCGEALALSHELQLNLAVDDKPLHIARTYTKPWTACPLLLDGHIASGKQVVLPREPFDIIDTSNLGDHLGSINILTATGPLLRRSVSSVLYNESLLMASEDVSTSLTTILGSDVATFSLLMGLVPAGLVTGATLDAVGNEEGLFAVVQSAKNQARQYRMRISWKCPEYADSAAMKVLGSTVSTKIQVQFGAKELAEYLFSIYRAMFAHEDVTKMMSRMQRMTTGHYSDNLQWYTRAGLVALLRIVKTRVLVNWDQTMYHLYHCIENDKQLIVGNNSLQELGMHLHLFGVWTTDALKVGFEQLRKDLESELRSSSGETGILAGTRPPPIVCLVLVVPRKNLKVFTDRSPDDIGTPALHVAVTQVQGKAQHENCFYSFYSFFGKIRSMENGLDASVIEEDSKGWAGSSDLVVTCAIPTYGLLTGPKSGIRAALMINTNPANIMNFRHLGVRMAVFEAGLAEKKSLFICRDAPKLESVRAWSMQREWVEASRVQNQASLQSFVKLNGEARATHLKNHVDFAKQSSESRSLSDGAEVRVVESSPCTLSLHIGDLVQDLVFAFPIRGSLSKVRVARKSSWIEVEVPIFTTLDGDYLDSWTQALPDSRHRFLWWSIPRVNLEIQPILRFPPKGDSNWLSIFMGTTLSNSERVLNDQGGASSSNPKVDLKQTIHVMLTAFAGLHPQAKRSIKTFQIAIESTGCHTMIFATAVHHDLDLGSIVMEAYVVPFTISRVKELSPALSKLLETEPLSIKMSDGESMLFKRMLPALAERCRTWKHKTTCQYQTKGVPVSIEHGHSPLCGCGEGKISSVELAKSGMKQWAPFAKYATRIAIAPIFPVPYVEQSLSNLKDLSLSEPRKGKGLEGGASTVDRCSNCGTSNGALKACGGYGKVKYCGQACQKAAWKTHKSQCKKS